MNLGRLSDPWFEAEFYGRVEGDLHWDQGSEIEGAQGLSLNCPCGQHSLMIPFANPRNAPSLPADHGPVARDGSHHPRWTMSGSGLSDLTLTPSVDVGTPSCWHGFITNGAVT